jgi:hypothetical protein
MHDLQLAVMAVGVTAIMRFACHALACRDARR